MASSKQQQTAPAIGHPAAEKLYMQLNESELTAIIMKGSPNSNDRDAGFCSGSSEGGDDLSIEHSRLEHNSAIEASDDSLEIKVTPISLVRNKRKSSEPSKVVCESTSTATSTKITTEEVTSAASAPFSTTHHSTLTSSSSTGPLKKRIRYTSSADSAVVLTPTSIQSTPTSTPPQIWDPSQVLPHELMPNPAQIFVRHPGVTTLHRMPLIDVEEQLEPLALISKKRKIDDDTKEISTSKKQINNSNGDNDDSILPNQPKSRKITSKKLQNSKTKSNHLVIPKIETETEIDILTTAVDGSSVSDASLNNSTNSSHRPQQRNYKNMTRERRIEANARERTRVHTISAAYETLRQSVPSYSNAQKLSKLSVLRVACSYILTLSRLAGHDYSDDQSEPSIASCFDAVTSTIMTEGKIRKKKDE